ncbi:MAG: insulinase family protein [Bacteriovoracaceae bacterium]|nr:insulinase family protein [Bacteriovoracaceae bacterium]
MQHQHIKLSNNLETLFVNAPGSTAASVQIWFRAGSALEDKKNEGIAHFLEHMFFKGTKNRPAGMVAHEVESFGGEVNAFTSFDYTCYYINTPNSKLSKTIEILLDMVSNPLFANNDLLPEREVVFEEFRRAQDHPGQYSFLKIQKNCFVGGYSHPILGNQKSIKNFTVEQVKKFRNKYYNVNNALLIVAGDLRNKSSLTKAIEKYKIPNGPATIFPNFSLKQRAKIDIHCKDVRMSQLTLCLKSPSYTDNNATSEDLAINCLGHGDTSRLYNKLVLETSLANTSSASTMYMAKGGAHFIRINFPHKHFSKVIKIFQQIIDEVLYDGLKESEIKKIKKQYVSSKIYEKEALESYAFSLGHGFAQTGDIHCEEAFIEKMKKTSRESVNKALRDIFEREVHLNLQIPKDESLQKSKLVLEKFKNYMDTKRHKLKQRKESSDKAQKAYSKYDSKAQVIRLKKGITLIYRQNTMTPTFILHSYVKGGLSEETKNTSGVYNLLSSVMVQGHNDIPDSTIRNTLENCSASLSGFTGKNAYGLTLHGQTEHLPELLKHFMGSLLSPDVPSKELEHEKEMALRALESQKEDATKICFRAFLKSIFRDHPYSMNIIGTQKSIPGITRNMILSKHNKNLKTKEIVITYCGDSELEDLMSFLDPYLQGLKARPQSNTIAKQHKPVEAQEIFIPFDRQQTQILLGFQAPSMKSKDHLYLKMLTTHLSGQSSDLFVLVRDRLGLCYTVSPVHFMAVEGGYWGVYMASGHDKVSAAILAIRKILENIQNNGLSQKEFNRIKKMIDGQNLLNIQTNDDYANIYSVPVLHGQNIDFFYDRNEAIKKLTYDSFQKNIKKILGNAFNVVIVGRDK